LLSDGAEEKPMKTGLIAPLSIALTTQLVLSLQSGHLPAAPDMKTIGLVGGTSWYSTVEYFLLIIKPADVAVPVFDTTLLHSQMAVDFILGKQGLAHVRAVQ